jgi:hypothetical protein
MIFMKITFEPDPENIRLIRTNWDAQEIARKFLQAAGVSDSDSLRWNETHLVDIDKDKQLIFWDMPCFIAESLRICDSWKLRIQYMEGAYTLKINSESFWSIINSTSCLNNLPINLANFSCRGWPLAVLNKPLPNLSQLNSLDISNSDFILDVLSIASFEKLAWIKLSDCKKLTDISPLANLHQLTSIDLSNCKNLTDISPLANLHQLTSINLSNCKKLTDISPLANLHQLTSINLSDCNDLTDISPLANLHQLTSINLSNCNDLADINPLANLHQLISINLESCYSLTDISPLANLKQLISINLESCYSLTDINPLRHLRQLNSINLSRSESRTDISPIENLANIHYLNLSDCTNLTDISPLEKCFGLSTLDLDWCHSLKDIGPISNLYNLENLYLGGCHNIKDSKPLEKLYKLKCLKLSKMDGNFDINHFANLINLSFLEISNFQDLTDIRPLANLLKLTCLDISMCKSITDISPLANLQQLNSIDLSKCMSITDISPLANLQQLNSINLSECKSVNDISPLAKIHKITELNIQECGLISSLSPIQGHHKIESIDFENCLRITEFPRFKELSCLKVLRAHLHPTIIKDILAHCAVSREDWVFIKKNAKSWTSELESALKDSHPAAFDLATSLAIAFPKISFELSERLCQILQIDASLDYRPWKQLFLGVFQHMGFCTLQNLANTIAAGLWPRGAIGGLSAIAEQLITLADGKDWFAGWVRAISAQHESNPSFLKPVAAPWCLALHCLGENALLDQWIARFTDPDDSTALDAVFLEFGNHRLGVNHAPGAFRHAMRIRATLVRDGLLTDIASHYLEAQQADRASELLFLLSAEDKRAELSLKLADIPHFLDNRDNLHRLLAACGKNAPAIGKLLAKTGMDEIAFPGNADDERQRAAQDAAQMASIRTGLDSGHVVELSELITHFLKNKAYTP